jgi:hypothetical protein
VNFIPLRADEVIDPRLILFRTNRSDATTNAGIEARDIHPPSCRTANAQNEVSLFAKLRWLRGELRADGLSK